MRSAVPFNKAPQSARSGSGAIEVQSSVLGVLPHEGTQVCKATSCGLMCGEGGHTGSLTLNSLLYITHRGATIGVSIGHLDVLICDGIRLLFSVGLFTFAVSFSVNLR